MNNEKFKIDVMFSKNRHYPKFGPEAYSIESHSVFIPYGKKFHFKTSKKTIEFIKNKITPEVLELFDSIYITKWKGYSGTTEILKDRKGKNDIYPINKELIEILLTF